MTINCAQLKDIIIKPALQAIGMLSDDAVMLLLGTAAQETQMGRYIIQTNVAPYNGGIGIYQMEAKSYDFVWSKRVDMSVAMKAQVRLYLGYEGKPQACRMASDLALSTIMARLYYANISQPIPSYSDLEAMASYYKRYWNTASGAATTEQFIQNYKSYIT